MTMSAALPKTNIVVNDKYVTGLGGEKLSLVKCKNSWKSLFPELNTPAVMKCVMAEMKEHHGLEARRIAKELGPEDVRHQPLLDYAAKALQLSEARILEAIILNGLRKCLPHLPEHVYLIK